jgi:uncharacterized LabA/DUF88 family protein
MIKRVAVLLDGAFVTKRLRKIVGRFPTPAEVLSIAKRIEELPVFEDHELLRIYYYDALPAAGNIRNPVDGSTINLGHTEVHARALGLLAALELAPNVAVRLGDVSVHGWQLRPHALESMARMRRTLTSDDLVLDIEQKGVDLRIGLDIARLSLQKLVTSIVVVTGDSDMIPAFKFARREGLRVYLDHLGGPVKRELKAHVDVVL